MYSDSFGELLRQLRKRAAMTQGDLAAATGYSTSYISSLECGARRPDVVQVKQRFVPALGLHDAPRLASRLVELAANVRGEKLPVVPDTQPRRPRVLQADEDEDEDEAGGGGGIYLPLPPSEIIGRAAEIKLLSNRLLGHRGRLLTLTGPPGVGKTRLALELALQLAPLSRDGARFVSLAALQDAAQLAPAISAALGIAPSGKKPPGARLVGHLRRTQMLLVLDNFETLLGYSSPAADPSAGPTLIATLLGECPELQIIVTSRTRLHLRAEQRHKVAPLAVTAAVELFRQRARLLECGVDLTADDQPILHTICQELDCLPLAIELAAARLDLYTPTALLAEIRAHRLDVLVDGALDLPPRQRTLRTAIQSSYEALSDAEQALFCDLSVFAGSFEQAAVSALDHDPTQLEALLSKSMLASFTHEGATRFFLLETLREFAREELAQSQRAASTRRRHADFFAALAHAAVEHIHTGVQTAWLERLEQEHNNLRAALQWLLTHDPAGALALCVDLDEFWHLRGYGSEAESGLRTALAAEAEPTLLRAQALLALAAVRRRAGSYAAAAPALHEAEQIIEAWTRREAQNSDSITAVQLKFCQCAGWHCYDLHDYAGALVNFERGLLLARGCDNNRLIVRFLTALVHLQRNRAEAQATVMAHLEECLIRLQQLDDPAMHAFVLQQYGALEVAAERYAGAAQYYRRALEICRTLSDKAGLAWALELVGEVAWFKKDLDTAQRYYAEAYALFALLDNPDGTMIAQHHLAQVARAEGRWEEARALYGRSLRQALALKNRHMMARGLAGLGGVALRTGCAEDAALLLSSARQALAALPPFLAPADQRAFAGLLAQIEPLCRQPAVTAAWARGEAMTVEQVVLTALQRWNA